MKLGGKKLEVIHYLIFMAVMGIVIALQLAFNQLGDASRVTEPLPPVRTNKIFTPDSPPLPALTTANLVSKIETSAPVVFLTMDDGLVKDERVIDFLKRRQWPVSLFPADEYAKGDYDYFKRLAANGATIQNHTISHHYLHNLTYEQQLTEICSASDLMERIFKLRPTLLRPPGGHYDSNTFIAAKHCGIRAVVMWSAKVDGGQVQFQKGDRLERGDIVLMHFRPKVMEDLKAFETEIIKQGLYVAKLEDWLHVEE